MLDDSKKGTSVSKPAVCRRDAEGLKGAFTIPLTGIGPRSFNLDLLTGQKANPHRNATERCSFSTSPTFILFIFQLQLTFTTVLVSGVQHAGYLYNLHSNPSDNFSSHITITTLSAIFPVLHHDKLLKDRF